MLDSDTDGPSLEESTLSEASTHLPGDDIDHSDWLMLQATVEFAIEMSDPDMVQLRACSRSPSSSDTS